MKKKNEIVRAVFTLAIGCLLLSGCKKDDNNSSNATTDELSAQKVNADDETRVSAESDEVIDEINGAALTNKRFCGGMSGVVVTGNHVPCHAVIDSSLASQGTYVITFNGANCAGTRTRTGSITLQLPYNSTTNTVTTWSTAGCLLTVTFNNFKVTWNNNGKSLTFNGTKYITNVNGGIVDDSQTFLTPIVHHVTGMMQITFDDNTARTWNIDRTRSIARTNYVTTVTIMGNATENGITHVAIWGINRQGNTFTVSLPTPIVLSSACSFHPMSGVRVHTGVVRVLTVNYGVDQSGNPVTTGCPYGYKLNWINHNGTPMQVVIAY